MVDARLEVEDFTYQLRSMGFILATVVIHLSREHEGSNLCYKRQTGSKTGLCYRSGSWRYRWRCCSRDFECLNKKNEGVKGRMGRMVASERKIQKD